MVQRTIARLAFPGGKQRPKPGPYRGELNKSALKNENERSGLSREGYVPKWQQEKQEVASGSNTHPGAGGSSSNGAAN